MDEDISDLIKNVKKMIDNTTTSSNFKEAITNNSNEPSERNTNSSNVNIDIDTILKMKTIIDSINNNNDPRANLLNSLKPYLRDSRKNKLDQYINLLNMTKIAEIINNKKKENPDNDQ